jgi:rhodanese-related sulfurtransferase
MEHLPEFVANHTGLVLAFAVVAGLLAWNLFGAGLAGFIQAEPGEVVRLINHEDATVVDVRENHEYADGHILNSIHIPLSSLSGQIGKLEKYRQRPLILSCQSGHRSAHACRILKQNGFENIYNMRGGMTAWHNANLPVKKGKK